MDKKKEKQVKKTYTSKTTYLLSPPFPVEEIILGNTKEKVLRFLYKGGNPHSISKGLNLSRPTIIQHLNELRKINLVEKGINDSNKYGNSYRITEKGKFLIENCVGFPVESSHKGRLSPTKNVRGHAFILKIKPDKQFNWKSLLEKNNVKSIPKGIANTPRIILNGKKTWLGKNFITIYFSEEDSFFAKDPIKSYSNAVYEMTEDMKDFKKLLGIEFKYKFTCRRQHYGFVDNPEAKHFLAKKKKILIKNEKGYWFSIDFSQNKYKEAEILKDDKKQTLSTSYQNYMNSHEKTKFEVTPTFLLSALNKIAENQANNEIQVQQFTKQIKSHLSLIQEYRKENISWRKEKIKEIRKEVKEGKQTKLGEFF